MSASTQYIVALELDYPEKIVKRALRKYKFKDAGSFLEYVDTHMEEFEGEDEEEKEEPPPEEKNITIQPTREDVDKAQGSTVISTTDQIKELSLKEETEILYRQSLCLMCWKERRTILCLPCCHFTLCDMCEKTTRTCPLRDCKEVIAGTVRTYIA